MNHLCLAAADPLEHVLDRPWLLNGQHVPWMSAHIAAMILVGLICLGVLPLLARRRGVVPRGAYHALELFVVFVRERVARPALGSCADKYVPFLATLLAFLLGCNLTGLAPLPAFFSLIGNEATPVGGTATGSLYVCGALAGMTLVILLAMGYWKGVKMLWKGKCQDAHASGHNNSQADGNLVTAACEATFRRRWPLPAALVIGVPIWLNAFVPPMPGLMGMALWPFLLVLEVFSLVSRMFALCIRLFANMTSGHLLLFVVIGFAGAGRGWSLAYISIPSGLGALVLMGLELFVSVLQAYIFTFLTAIFIGMVVNPQH